MSPLLRQPQAVPSLFSRGSEHDDACRPLGGPFSPVATQFESLAAAIGLGGEDTLLGRTSRALAGTALAIFVIGLPLMQATKAVVSLSFAH